ncbi:MAG: tRNA (guanosine(37)-N1)-methyltransferase TrmD, partial [Myxococcota bacterium]
DMHQDSSPVRSPNKEACLNKGASLSKGVKPLAVTFVSLFPDSLQSMLQTSVVGRAVRTGRVAISTQDIRQHGLGKHKRVDEAPFGGGPGQLMRVDVVVSALRAALARAPSRARVPSRVATEGRGKQRVILVDAAGESFTPAHAKQFAQQDHLVFVCGRYEGIDSRIYHYVDDVISVGDYVLTSGELASLVVLDATLRYVPGVLGNPQSSRCDSFEEGLLEHSQYTAPLEFEGRHVPDVLRCGHHARVAAAQRAERLIRTKLMRPKLFDKATLCETDRKLVGKAEPSTFPWSHHVSTTNKKT